MTEHPTLELDAKHQALARSRLYGLLARLLIRGVEQADGLDASTLAQLEALGWAPKLGLDELAAEHHSCFSLGVFPYAGVFLDDTATAGGFADEVRGYYDRLGFTPRLDELSADHLGVELALLSFVTGAQADALEDRRPAIAAALDHELARFLDTCVLSYLPALVCAVAALPEVGFWASIVRATLDVVAEHRSHLPGPIAAASLAAPADLLGDERTGLRRIAEHLLTPAASGVFLSRSDIAGLGREHQLPRGFGSRVLMLDNLLRSAVDYGELAPLLTALDARLGERDQALATLASDCALEPAIAPWRSAIARTRALLHQIAERAPEQAEHPWTSKPSTTPQPAP